MSILRVDDVTVQFGGVVALDRASFSVDDGQICGLIGPNGAGKTTMFNVITRLYQPTAGSVWFQNHDMLAVRPHHVAGLGIARTFQNLALWSSLNVVENVALGAHPFSSVNFLTASLALGRREQRASFVTAFELLERLGLEQLAFESVSELPFGTLKRIEIARALAARPRLLLLDEPAGGLNHSEVDELAELVSELRDEFDLTILLVEHHMAMVMGVSQKVVVLDFGRTIADGEPATVAADSKVIEAYLG